MSVIASPCERCDASLFCPSSATLHSTVETIELVRDQVLCHSNDDFNGLYALNYGSLKSSLLRPSGDEEIMSFYFKGELAGFAAIDTGKYRTSLRALEPTTVCKISLHNLLVVSERSPAMQSCLLSLISRRVNTGFYTKMNLSALEKVASFLWDFCLRTKPGEIEDRDRFHLPMSRNDVGAYLSLTVETVSRMFSQLQDSSIIQCSGKHLAIENVIELKMNSCF